MTSRLFIVFGLITVFLAACGSAETLVYTEVPQDLLAQQQQLVQEAAIATMTAQGPQEAPATLAPSPIPTQETAAEELPTAGPVEVLPTDVPPTDPVADTNTARPALGFELGSSNFKTTNPVSVSLASGEIQVLEFFAEW